MWAEMFCSTVPAKHELWPNSLLCEISAELCVSVVKFNTLNTLTTETQRAQRWRREYKIRPPPTLRRNNAKAQTWKQ